MDENTCVACGCDIPEGRHVCAKCEAGVVSRADILDEAKHIVTHDRNEQYGKPEDCFERIASLWSAYLNHAVHAHDVGAMMVLLTNPSNQLWSSTRLILWSLMPRVARV